MSNLEELLELAEQHAQSVIFEQRRQLAPSWILSDGKVKLTLATPWGNEAERQLAKLFMRLQVKLNKTIAYSFVSEVWTAAESFEPDPNKAYVEPRKRPDRQEIVLALATDGKLVRTRAWKIIRNWNEAIGKLEPKDMGDGVFTGWMASLLGEPKG
jgi:hypothetical protein